MADIVFQNDTATPVGLWDVDSVPHVAGAMGGVAVLDPDMTSAQVIGVYVESGEGVTSAPAAPANVEPPTISGDAVEGETLVADPGVWTGNPAPTFTVQWQSSEDDDAFSDMEGVTGWTFDAPVIGEYYRVVVTATNVIDDESETSASVGPVLEAD